MTKAQARGVVSALQKEFRSRIIRKDKAPLMRMASRIVKRRVGMGPEDFGGYVTTLGRRIYVPFPPNLDDNTRPLWAMVRVLIHEHQHIAIQKRMGFFRYVTRYSRDSRERALIEAECYAAEFSWQYARHRTMPAPENYAQRLYAYGCTEEDVAAAAEALRTWALRIEDGIRPKAARVAVLWAVEHAPEILFLEG